MNIGMILDDTFPPDPRVENEALSLIQSGHKVFLYCLDYTRRLPVFENINGINVYRQRFPGIIYSLSALAYTIPVYHLYLKRSLSHFLRKNHIQVIHVHDMQVARSVFWVTKKIKIPVVLDFHENRPEIMKYYSHVSSFLGKLLIYPSIWKRFEHRYIIKADKIIVVTEEAKEYYRKKTGVSEKKIVVVPNTVRKGFYTDYKIDDKIIDRYAQHFMILYLGDTGKRRGLTTMINSLKYLVKLIPEIKLVIVGSSDNDNYLKQLVTTLHYNDYVDFTGWVDVALFPSYILSGEIGACPIHKNIHHDTTYANKIFQSLAFGKPVVVSDCKAQENIVEKYNFGLVFKDQDARDFADKILKLYHDKNLYNTLSKNGRKAIAEELNWDNNTFVLKKLYEDL